MKAEDLFIKHLCCHCCKGEWFLRLFLDSIHLSLSPGCFPTWMTRSWTTLCPGSLSSTCDPADLYRTNSPTSGNRAGSPVAKTKPTTFSPTSPCASSSWWVGDFYWFCKYQLDFWLCDSLLHRCVQCLCQTCTSLHKWDGISLLLVFSSLYFIFSFIPTAWMIIYPAKALYTTALYTTALYTTGKMAWTTPLTWCHSMLCVLSNTWKSGNYMFD